MEEQTFQLLMSKLDAMHDDLRQHQKDFALHVEDDQKQWNEVSFIKRAFQVTWTGLGAVLTYIGFSKH